LALGGARVVSIPDALAVHTGHLGTVADVPGDGLAVLEAFEEIASRYDVSQLAATLAAASARSFLSPENGRPGRVRRLFALRRLK
jgi:hypothetical protein